MARRSRQQVTVDRLIPAGDVCHALAISRATFERWQDQGLLRVIRVGRGVRMRASDLAKITRTGVALLK
jgi:excisionase family DNA binding protein